jgi:heat shock protein HslJ
MTFLAFRHRVFGPAGFIAALLLMGCSSENAAPKVVPAPQSSSVPPTAVAPVAAGTLAGTRWQLVEIQSMDDSKGTTKPADGANYIISFGKDGTVSLTLDCIRGTARWTAKPADSGSGGLEFGPIAATTMLCPPPSLGETLGAQLPYVRSYIVKDGRLYLSLMADGGIIAWEIARDPH